MSASPAQPPEQSSAGAAGKAADSQLLIDQFLPTYDVAVVHADVLRAPPAQSYLAASELDLFQAPLVRTLLGIRALPQRVVGTLRGRGKTTTLEASRRTFRLKDMVGLGWILLGETPGVEMVLGQVSRPWKAVAATTHAPTTPEQFTSFDEPGFAKIATSLRIDPYGNDSSILTMETRVAITDDKSRRRFRRYWLLIGPFSSLIRRMALRLLATEFRRSAPGRPNDGGIGSRQPTYPQVPRLWTVWRHDEPTSNERIALAYLKPPAFTRHLANPLAMRLSARGVATLTVVGRRTGDPHKVPVIPIEVGQSRYLVSPYGESDWVRNLRAAGTGELSRKGQTEVFQAAEIPVDERRAIIARYREVAGSLVGPCFTKLPDARDHPVFRIV